MLSLHYLNFWIKITLSTFEYCCFSFTRGDIRKSWLSGQLVWAFMIRKHLTCAYLKLRGPEVNKKIIGKEIIHHISLPLCGYEHLQMKHYGSTFQCSFFRITKQHIDLLYCTDGGNSQYWSQVFLAQPESELGWRGRRINRALRIIERAPLIRTLYRCLDIVGFIAIVSNLCYRIDMKTNSIRYAWPKFSQSWSLQIRRSANFMKVRNVVRRIFKVQSCERIRRAVSCQ